MEEELVFLLIAVLVGPAFFVQLARLINNWPLDLTAEEEDA